MTGPVAQGRYVLATRHGELISSAGMTPRRDGVLILTGAIQADRPLADYAKAVTLATANALTALRGRLVAGERIARVLNLTVYIAAGPGFAAHSQLADFASDHLFAVLGEAGIGSRTAVGVASLPGDAPVEIQILAVAGTDSAI